MEKVKYAAYGSNLNLEQMARRCPTAKVVGQGVLKDYQLTFRNVATIEPIEKAVTPIAIWELEHSDELALDRYEGYPSLYRKETVLAEMNGEPIKVMVYIMNMGSPSMPPKHYFDVIEQGYADVGLDVDYLTGALADTKQRISGQRR